MKIFRLLILASIFTSLISFSGGSSRITRYTLTVDNGNGGGRFRSGEGVTISANNVVDMEFEKWVGDIDVFSNSIVETNSSSVTFNMPRRNIKLTAQFKLIVKDTSRYNLNVIDGIGSGSHLNEEVIYIEPEVNPFSVFLGWESNDIDFVLPAENPYNAILMKDRNITVTAKYRSIRSREQVAYKSYPHNIPGLIEAEDFDYGGQNISYFDSSLSNSGNVYRTDFVDIGRLENNNFKIFNINNKEWVEYSVWTKDTNKYQIRLSVGSSFDSSKIAVYIDDALWQVIEVPNTEGAQNLTILTTDVIKIISSGYHTLKIEFLSDENNTNLLELDFIEMISIP